MCFHVSPVALLSFADAFSFVLAGGGQTRDPRYVFCAEQVPFIAANYAPVALEGALNDDFASPKLSQQDMDRCRF